MIGTYDYVIITKGKMYYVHLFPLEEFATIMEAPLEHEYTNGYILFNQEDRPLEELILNFVRKGGHYGYRIKSVCFNKN